jgi:hypothetical protein
MEGVALPTGGLLAQGMRDLESLSTLSTRSLRGEVVRNAALPSDRRRGCWIWRGARTRDRRPVLWIARGCGCLVARVVHYLETHDDLGAGATFEPPSCGDPMCVRPAHVVGSGCRAPSAPGVPTPRPSSRAYRAARARRRPLTVGDVAFVLANYRAWTVDGEGLVVADLAAVMGTEQSLVGELVSWGRREAQRIAAGEDHAQLALLGGHGPRSASGDHSGVQRARRA